MGYLTIALLQISRRFWKWKNFENLPVLTKLCLKHCRLFFSRTRCISIVIVVFRKNSDSNFTATKQETQWDAGFTAYTIHTSRYRSEFQEVYSLNKLWCESTTHPVPALRIATSRSFSELTKNVIRSSHGHFEPSLKISCKSVQPFSRNVAYEERKKERKNERYIGLHTYIQTKKAIENNTPSPDVLGTGY